MVKRLTITGSTLRPRDASEKARLAAAVEATVWPWIEAGKFKPTIDHTFPLAEAAKAHACLEAVAPRRQGDAADALSASWALDACAAPEARKARAWRSACSIPGWVA